VRGYNELENVKIEKWNKSMHKELEYMKI